MIFKLHYWFLAAGYNAIGILLGVFIRTYTDASSLEIGALFMLMPFLGVVFRPVIASMADREQAHRRYLMICLLVIAFSYLPFAIIPMLGPEIYEKHARICWYLLVSLKVIGDIALGGVLSVGDALAINYARRIGTEFSTYRVWGTISWLCFGLIIGQINEAPYLPKYVPGFLILIVSSLLDFFCIWLWPEDYFKMVPFKLSAERGDKCRTPSSGSAQEPQGKSYLALMSKSLMPKEVVWAHAKGKLVWLLTLGCVDRRQQPVGANQGPKTDSDALPSQNQQLKQSDSNRPEEGINKMTQLRILKLLLRNDPRILLYLVYFVGAGACCIPNYFFFMSLAELCHVKCTCHFSMLAGWIQVATALSESILFLYIKRVVKIFGRVNMAALAFGVAAGKYFFYGTLWQEIDPHWALVAEFFQGMVFVVFITLMVELAHLFSNEVEFLVPQLIERGIITKETSLERVKLSLSATMQALVASANDGLGRGFGALIYGILLEHYDYTMLWLIVATGAVAAAAVVAVISLVDHIFDFGLGLDVAAARRGHLGASTATLELGLSDQRKRRDSTRSFQSIVDGCG